MGNLVDRFIIRPKEEFRDSMFSITDGDINTLVSAVPDEWQDMFRYLLESGKFSSVDEIMTENNNEEIGEALSILFDKSSYTWEDFDNRYRGKCLKYTLRRSLYDTIAIIENDFSWDKTNQYTIAGSGSCITEEEYESKMPADQVFLHKACETLVKNGFDQVHAIDGTVYKKD